MQMRIFAASLLSAVAAIANAQAPGPVPPSNPTGQAAVPATVEQTKGGDTSQLPVQRPSSARPGFVLRPMNIRIQDEGIKMPKCTTESRDGEACKK